MATYDASAVDLLVFTFKAGMLSAAAHDLQLRVGELELDVDEAEVAGGPPRAVRLRCNPRSLVVVSAMREGREDFRALSAKDKGEIERNIERDVLHPAKFPAISFDSDRVEGGTRPDELRLRGRLLLHGVTRPIETTARRDANGWTAEVSLNQPDFRVKPFSALLGSLKIQPRVLVRIRVRTG
jgi:hypothetical protein